jgi:hypothetical protein
VTLTVADKVGNPGSSTAEVITLDTSAPGTISSLNADTDGTSGVYLTFHTPSATDLAGVYIYWYLTSDALTNGNTTYATTTSNSDLNTTVTRAMGLNADSYYTFQLYAVDKVGNKSATAATSSSVKAKRLGLAAAVTHSVLSGVVSGIASAAGFPLSPPASKGEDHADTRTKQMLQTAFSRFSSSPLTASVDDGNESSSGLAALPASFWTRPQAAGRARPSSAYAGMVPQAAIPAAGAGLGAEASAAGSGDVESGLGTGVSPIAAARELRSSEGASGAARVSVSLATPLPADGGSPAGGQKPSAPVDPQGGRPAFAVLAPAPWREEDEEEAE